MYTYFKSKEQIYMAVVESELEMLSTQMEKAASKPVSPDKKILELIMTHLDAIKMVVYRNGTLRADFFRDIWRVAISGRLSVPSSNCATTLRGTRAS